MPRDVARVLDAAAELTSNVDLLLLDDGSTDESYEVAYELSQRYPQVRLMRRERGARLSDSLRSLRSQIESDVVIVHDGSSHINAEQLRLIWSQQRVLGALRDNNQSVSFADLRRPAQTHPQLADAHRRLLGFQRIVASRPIDKENSAVTEPENKRTDGVSKPAPSKRSGMGAIPPLPKSNLFGALTDFALGE